MPIPGRILVWPWRFDLTNRPQICARLSRFLLALIFVELLTMPITQHFWIWDHFLRGGQDFELGLFVIVSCLCLVLLRAQHGHQRVRHLLALRRRTVLPCRHVLFRFHLAVLFVLAVRAADPPLHRSLGSVFAPLQI